MKLFRLRTLALVAALATGASAVSGGAASGPAVGSAATLSVWRGGAWHAWWRADRAPARWSGPDSSLMRAVAWRPLGAGVEWASVRMACEAPAWRTKLLVVRIDPRRVRIGLELALSPEAGRPAWSVERAPRDAIVAVNAGQFGETLPWGWVVIGGREHLRAGAGPLARALAFERSGAVRWLPADSLEAPGRGTDCAFQSYPSLLAGGEVPQALREPGHGVDLSHRDARLAIGETRDGRLLLVMTRFDALGESAGALPVGPTSPEMAAVMGALGARDAVMLDGGISAQMRLRDVRSGRLWTWRGWRKVPLALVVRARRD